MALEAVEPVRISGRMKNALVADLVLADPENGDEWLVSPMRDEYEWTEHFGRQLGMRRTYGPGGIHDTLMVLVVEVDEWLRTWPPKPDPKSVQTLAHQATKFLTPVEVYATLLAGPGRWGQARIDEGCRLDRLGAHMQPMLEKALASEINRLLDDWVKWDIRKLRERRDEALKALRAAQPKAVPERPPRIPYQRPTGKERAERLKHYHPPGRT